MAQAFIVELTMQLHVTDPVALSQAAVNFFDQAQFLDDADGSQRAATEQEMREKLDQALQTLIRPPEIVRSVPGVRFDGGRINVRAREPN